MRSISGSRDGEPRLRAFAVAPPGLEDLVAAELRHLGLAVEPVEGGAEFDGELRELLLVNLWARVASRVLVRVGEFEAATFSALERGLRGLRWSDWLPRGAALRVKVAKRRTRLFHTGKVAEVALEVISTVADAGNPEGTGPFLDVYLRLDGSHVTASLDTSGEHLHRRGYRSEAGAAPIRENLAAGLLLRSRWDGSEALFDPFCGSGTFPIEAALLSLRIAPGLGRSFAFERFAGFEARLWESLRQDAVSQALSALPAPVFGADRNPAAVALAARSARRAGLADHVQVAVADLADVEPPARQGLLVANPPYGLRLSGGRESLRVLGAALRGPYSGWRWGAILPSDDRGAEGALGVPVVGRRSFRSGGLRLRWAQGGMSGDATAREQGE